MVGNCSPDFSSVQNTPSNEVTSLDLGQPAMSLGTEKPGDTIIDVTPPLSAFHYHLSSPWRLPYYESPVHKEFRSFIYAFTWVHVVFIVHMTIRLHSSGRSRG